jgi:uncharacterized membrane protein
MSATPRPPAGWRRLSAVRHLTVSLAAGAVGGAVAAVFAGAETATLLAWVVTAAVFLVLTWTAVWSLDASETAVVAQREDPARPIRDLAMLAISIGALVTVVAVIFRVHQNPPLRTALAVASIAASWLVVNTIFALRYVRLYYSEPRGGINFNQEADPTFRDFTYVGFTIGMTFQVSDTTLQNTEIRTTALQQALMSFVYYTMIIAVTVNIIAGLGQ